LPRQSGLQEALHEGHWEHRSKLINALWLGGLDVYRRRAARLANCGTAARFYIAPDVGQVRPWLSRCKDKLCPFCAHARSGHVRAQLLDLLMQMTRPRILVLTIRSCDLPLRDQLVNLRSWFARLRNRKAWKERVRAGAYTLEITRNVKTGQWHPHLHIVYDGEYFPQKLLRRLWHTITGDSEIVWLQEIHDRPNAAAELCKYIGKVQKIGDLTDSEIREYATATKGIRMAQTFGALHGKKVEDTDPGKAEAPEEYFIPLGDIVRLAVDGEPTPLHLALLIAEHWPLFANYIYHRLPQAQVPRSDVDKYRRLRATLTGKPPPASGDGDSKDDRAAREAKLVTLFRRYHQEADQGNYIQLDHPWIGKY